MILIDTSVWIDFFRGASAVAALSTRLEAGDVLLHPWALGELALGQRGSRWADTVRDLRLLPRATVVGDAEVLAFVETRGLAGKGVGWVDVQLLASALADGATLWTLDRRLATLARSLRLTLL